MKKVIIRKLTLKNFRGIKDLEIDFNEETFVSGDNSTGKSTIFNSFCWLLFGKDKEDRKDYQIRPVIDGVLLRRVDCEVIGNFLIDGEEITLRRVFKERWVKPRGEIDDVFKGNETETFWNDVPLNITEYQRKISDIFLDESVFKMVTNPLFFANMKWQDQREQLFQLAGTITDNEIAAQKPEYAALLDKISGKSLADFKRELSARKKKLKDELDTIQPRIDQTHKLMPENTDFAALETEITSLTSQIQAIDEAITDKTKVIRLQYEATQKKQSEINELKQKRQQVLHDAKTAAKESVFEANAIRRSLESNIRVAESEFATLERSIQDLERELHNLKTRIANKNETVIAKRQEWNNENAVEYNGNDSCHECGQVLPEESRENARQLFSESKQKKLAQIKQNGIEINAEIEQLNKDVSTLETTLKTSKNDLESKKAEIENLKAELAKLPVVSESEINPEELTEYVELSTKIVELEAAIDNDTEKIDTSELQNQKKEINEKLDTAKSNLKNRDLIVQYKAEIDNLEAKGKQIAQQIADVEREEYTIQNFTKTKIEECERRINGLFTIVTFKLFDYTIENNEIETCVPLVNGVPFQAANTAGQISAGLDIIRALQRFHNVVAPIFCDNAESVNQYPVMENQMIFLKVTLDKNLVVK